MPRAQARRYDGSEYEPFWSVAEALDLPLSLHIVTRRQGKIRGAGPGRLRDASSGATSLTTPRCESADPRFVDLTSYAWQLRRPRQSRRLLQS